MNRLILLVTLEVDWKELSSQTQRRNSYCSLSPFLAALVKPVAPTKILSNNMQIDYHSVTKMAAGLRHSQHRNGSKAGVLTHPAFRGPLGMLCCCCHWGQWSTDTRPQEGPASSNPKPHSCSDVGATGAAAETQTHRKPVE